MKCFQCNKEIKNELHMVILNVDGDFVCDKKCKEEYEKEKKYFMDVVIHDDRKFYDWIHS